MRWMVVTTARGEFVTEFGVSEKLLVDVMCNWVRAMPDAGLYLDGELVPNEARALMQLAAEAPPPTPAAAPVLAAPPEPEKLRSYAEVLQLGFEDLRKGYVEYLGNLHDCAKRYGEMWLEREKQFADEAARQRELTHKSLKDADLLGRSVAAAQLKDVLASAGAQNFSRVRGSDGLKITDLLMGVVKTLTGEK
jgi:hypothetical protein